MRYYALLCNSMCDYITVLQLLQILATDVAEYEDNVLTIKAAVLAKVFNIKKAQYSKLKVKFELK